MTTIYVPLDDTDAAIVGATIQSMAALDRCGSPEGAVRMARVGAALSASAAGPQTDECRSLVADDRSLLAIHAAHIAGTQPRTAEALIRLLDGEVM